MGEQLAQPREPQPDDLPDWTPLLELERTRETLAPDTLSIAWERMNVARAQADAAAERFR